MHRVSLVLRCTLLLFALVCELSYAQPIVGQIYKEFLPMGSGASVPLPEGVWKGFHKDVMTFEREVWDVYLLKNEQADANVRYLVVRSETLPRPWGATPCNRANLSWFMLNEHGTTANGMLQKCSRATSINDFQGWKNVEKWNGTKADKDWWRAVLAAMDQDNAAFASSVILMELRVQQFNGGQLRVEAFVLPPAGMSAAQVKNQYISGSLRPEHDILSTWAAIYIEAIQQSYFNKKPQVMAALAYPVGAAANVQSPQDQQAALTIVSPVLFPDSKMEAPLPPPVKRPAAVGIATVESNSGGTATGAPEPAVMLSIEQQRRAMDEEKRKMAEQLEAMTQMLAKLQQENAAATAAKAKEALTQVVSEAVKPSQAVSYANRKALVIGNDTYSEVSPLKNAVADADAMAKALESVGYQVSRHHNLSEKKFKQALRDFRQQLNGGEEALFFFAGHGVQLNGANYLLPIDIKGDSEEQVKDDAILLQKILDDLEDKKTKFALAVIDACRDNPFKAKGRALGGRGLAPTTAATGQMVIFSAGFGQQALDRLGDSDQDKNGLFTRIFVKEMMKPGLSVDRVVRNVRNEVVRLARTVGHEQTPALYDQAIGEFYFRQ